MSESGEVRVPIPSDGAGYGGTAAEAPPPAYGDKPPTYSDATDPDAPPPSYDSLFGEFKQVDSPTGFLFFFRKAIGFIIGTVVAAVLIGLISLIPIAMIVIGSMKLHDCRVERYVPIYLIVGGVFGLFKSITNFYYRAKQRRSGEPRNPEDNVNPNPFDGVLNCFLLAWFVAGSVWVYRVWKPNMEDPDSPRYCDPVAYMFAFVLITLTYVLMLLFIFLTCCCGCLAICFGRRQSG